MGNRPRRLRDVFNPPPEASWPPLPRQTDELIEEVAASDEIDVEGLANQFKQSGHELRRAVEEELKDGHGG